VVRRQTLHNEAGLVGILALPYIHKSIARYNTQHIVVCQLKITTGGVAI
jgi:hypothetical protein